MSRPRKSGGRYTPPKPKATPPARWDIDPPAERNCFEAAMHVIGQLPVDANPQVCHGIAVGVGGEAEGRRYWHAWVEVDAASGRRAAKRVVLDYSHGLDVQMPRHDFYRRGTIDPMEVWRWSPVDAVHMILDYETWGPWVPDFDSLTDPRPSTD